MVELEGYEADDLLATLAKHAREEGFDVIVVTGDHATPSVLAGHGWQPVPVLVWSRYCGADPVTVFAERACAAGTLGVLPAHHLMSLVMANALRLTKFGA